MLFTIIDLSLFLLMLPKQSLVRLYWSKNKIGVTSIYYINFFINAPTPRPSRIETSSRGRNFPGGEPNGIIRNEFGTKRPGTTRLHLLLPVEALLRALLGLTYFILLLI